MKSKILLVVCILTGLIFINAGLNKFFNYMPVPEDLPEDLMKLMQAMMTIKWLMPLVAIAEILGGNTSRNAVIGVLRPLSLRGASRLQFV